MTVSCWLRAAVVATELAGDRSAALLATLGPEADEVRGAWARLRDGTREQAALRLALAARESPAAREVPRSPARGGRFLAAWMRGLDERTRAAVAAGFDAETLAAVRDAAPSATPLGSPHHGVATWLVARAGRCVARPLTAAEWTELLDELDAGPAATGEVALRVERAVRVLGRRGVAQAAARAVRS